MYSHLISNTFPAAIENNVDELLYFVSLQIVASSLSSSCDYMMICTWDLALLQNDLDGLAHLRRSVDVWRRAVGHGRLLSE